MPLAQSAQIFLQICCARRKRPGFIGYFHLASRVCDPQHSGKSTSPELFNGFPRARLLRVTDARAPRWLRLRRAAPCRGLPIRQPFQFLRARRLPIGDTAGWQPALRGGGSHENRSQRLISNRQFADWARSPENSNAETQPERGLSTLRSTAEDWQSARNRSGINSALRELPRRALKFSCEAVSRKGIGNAWVACPGAGPERGHARPGFRERLSGVAGR